MAAQNVVDRPALVGWSRLRVKTGTGLGSVFEFAGVTGVSRRPCCQCSTSCRLGATVANFPSALENAARASACGNLSVWNRRRGESLAMIVICNGETRETLPGVTLASLLDDLGLVDGHVAVEVNLEVVPRTQHADFVLQDGDRLEVVKLVGGG